MGEVRDELLVRASLFEAPAGSDVQQLISELGMTDIEVALFLGVNLSPEAIGSGTVQRWKAGKTPIPYPCWALLAFKAGYGPIWDF